jgi:hypothetical protein
MLLHIGSEARIKLREWGKAESVSINAVVVSMLEEFFKRLRRSRALRDELKLELRVHRGSTFFGVSLDNDILLCNSYIEMYIALRSISEEV